MAAYRLSPEAVANGWTLCVRNAHELVGDAEALLNARRYPRAASLAILAWEELGKALLVAEAAGLLADDIEGWRRFRHGFSSHKAKQYSLPKLALCTGAALRVRYWRSPGLPDPLGAIASGFTEYFRDSYAFSALAIEMGSPGIDDMKKRGFYVDFLEEHFLGPPELPARLSELLTRMVRHSLTLAEMIRKEVATLASDIGRIRNEWDCDPDGVRAALRNIFLVMEQELAESLKKEEGQKQALQTFLRGSKVSIAETTTRFMEVFGLAWALPEESAKEQ